ncbi:unnamed protein product, partial [Scytosiphon promiscuus]
PGLEPGSTSVPEEAAAAAAAAAHGERTGTAVAVRAQDAACGPEELTPRATPTAAPSAVVHRAAAAAAPGHATPVTVQQRRARGSAPVPVSRRTSADLQHALRGDRAPAEAAKPASTACLCSRLGGYPSREQGHDVGASAAPT